LEAEEEEDQKRTEDELENLGMLYY